MNITDETGQLITRSKVEHALESSKTEKAVGPDGIQISLSMGLATLNICYTSEKTK